MSFFCFFLFVFLVTWVSEDLLVWSVFQGGLMMVSVFFLGLLDVYNNIMGVYLDLLSSLMVLLVIWVCFVMVYAMKIFRFDFFFGNFFLFLVGGSLISLIFFFYVNYIIYFYVWFEAGMLGTLLMIIYYGSQPERWLASMYLVLFTLFGSIPFLVSVVILENCANWKFISMMDYLVLDLYYLVGFGVLISFFVKLPVFGFHLWLPKAHVEAPIGGSMLLAGVLLKFGGYGMVRFFFLFFIGLSGLMWIILFWGLIGSLFCLFVTFRQSDLKCYIAYSSVVHMSIMMSGLMTGSSIGGYGCAMMMLSHGLISCMLFCLANFMYERSGSRSIFVIGSLLRFVSCGVLLWSLGILGNIGMPPLMSFYSEFFIFFSIIFSLGKFSFFFCFVCFLVSGLVTTYFLVLCYHGENLESFSFEGFNMREFLMSMSMFWPVGFGGGFIFLM